MQACESDRVSSPVMRLLDAAFGHPRGPLGRLGAALMVRGNVEQETWAVEHAQLGAGSRVLVVGHGPGVGLVQAAAAVTAGGHVTGVDPSTLMRELAAVRCAEQIAAGVVEVREGTAENTGCPDASVDAVISVNNVMLWDRPAGFTELARVLRPDGWLVITVHRHVLGVPPDRLLADATAAGFIDAQTSLRPRKRNSPAVDLLARRAANR